MYRLGGWSHPTIPSDLVFHHRKRQQTSIRAAHFGDAHGLAAAYRRSFERADYRYSIGLVYNTFPVPPRLLRNGWNALNLTLMPFSPPVLPIPTPPWRTSTIRIVMPVDLRRAHRDLDRAVDKLYQTPSIFL